MALDIECLQSGYEYNFRPLAEVFDQDFGIPQLLGTVVEEQRRGWIILRDYYKGNHLELGGKLCEGLSGQETEVPRVVDASEFLPKDGPLFSWPTLQLNSPENFKLAQMCGLTENGPLPKLPLHPYFSQQSLDRAQPPDII